MTMEGMGLTPLESNLHKYDPVIISQIIQMIEADNYWHQKNFESVLTNLWRMWNEGSHAQEDISMYCTENSKMDSKMDTVEVIDLYSESKTENCEQHEGKSPKQESRDKMKINTIVRKKGKNRPEESKSTTKNEENETMMMCWDV